jgi:SAM-dependent methyltransferase
VATPTSPVEFFDGHAATWDATFDGASKDGHRRRVRLEAAWALIGPGPGTLLDCGCGSGHLLPPLLKAGWDVHGVDGAPAMLARARDRAPEAHLLLGRAEELPYERDSFDVVVAAGLLEYTDMSRSVPELARVLRPGGRAVLALRNGRAPMAAWRRRVVHPVARVVKSRVRRGRPPPLRSHVALSPRGARDLLAGVGLQVRSTEALACEILPDPLDAAVPRVAYRVATAAERFALLRAIFGAQRMVLAVKEEAVSPPPARPPASPAP